MGKHQSGERGCEMTEYVYELRNYTEVTYVLALNILLLPLPPLDEELLRWGFPEDVW